MRASATPRRGVDLRAAGWWLALGALAGALAGLVWGGIGGRLVMLALRESSPDAIGVTSDDGFEIGRVTFGGSLNLALGLTLGGALAGVAYVAVRGGLPPAARVPLATLFAAAAGGAAFVNPDGVDQHILDPRWLTVGAFIVLPAAAALTFALIVERVGRRGPRVLPPAPPRRVAAVRAVVTVAAVAVIVAASVQLADQVSQVA